MATIGLDPGERFEHTHTGPSTTYLISGDVEVQLGDLTIPLTTAPLAIPPNTPHTMINVGPAKAFVGCGHP